MLAEESTALAEESGAGPPQARPSSPDWAPRASVRALVQRRGADARAPTAGRTKARVLW